jgi:hypothetical protein
VRRGWVSCRGVQSLRTGRGHPALSRLSALCYDYRRESRTLEQRSSPRNQHVYCVLRTCVFEKNTAFWKPDLFHSSDQMVGSTNSSSNSSGMYFRVLSWTSTDFSEVRAASIIRAMTHRPDDGGSKYISSETSVDIQLRTRQYIPQDSELHTRRRENLKSHTVPIHFGSLERATWW